jgi:hypothetical protein
MINVNYVSIEGYLTNSLGWSIPKGSCLIMDEVDGMSSGDWGGVGAMTELVKITNVCMAFYLYPQFLNIFADSNNMYSK